MNANKKNKNQSTNMNHKASHSTRVFIEKKTSELYQNVRKDITNQKTEIISVINDAVASLIKLHQDDKYYKPSAENSLLNDDLKKQIEELNKRIQIAEDKAKKIQQEKEELVCKVSEFDSKLQDAYSINSREASLEAEKIRSALSKEFSFLYEDWLDYKNSEVSEGNYQSLQAIIKKAFRAIERNGINFKEKK